MMPYSLARLSAECHYTECCGAYSWTFGTIAVVQNLREVGSTAHL